MPSVEVGREDVVRAILAIDREFMDSVSAKDAAGAAASYADGACVLMPGRPAINGKAAILAFYQAVLAGPVRAITLHTTHVEVSGDLAYALGNNTIEFNPEGEGPREEHGKYVVVYRRDPAGGWKIVVDSYSSNG